MKNCTMDLNFYKVNKRWDWLDKDWGFGDYKPQQKA